MDKRIAILLTFVLFSTFIFGQSNSIEPRQLKFAPDERMILFSRDTTIGSVANNGRYFHWAADSVFQDRALDQAYLQNDTLYLVVVNSITGVEDTFSTYLPYLDSTEITATMPLTWNPLTGNISTSVNEGKLIGRFSVGGAGVMQEITVGTGLQLTTGGNLNNTAPDQVVVLNEGTNIDITGTYPNFTISSNDTLINDDGTGIFEVHRLINDTLQLIGYFDTVQQVFSNVPPLYIVITGQSNATPFANLGDNTPSNNTSIWNPDTEAWQPINVADAFMNGGPDRNWWGIHIGREAQLQDNRLVRIVYWAANNQPITQWTTGAAKTFFDYNIPLSNIPRIDAICWWQGEAESAEDPALYETQFDSVRTNFSLYSAWRDVTRWVVCEIHGNGVDQQNEVYYKLSIEADSNYDLVRTKDLPPLGVAIHINTESHVTLGRRIYNVLKRSFRPYNIPVSGGLIFGGANGMTQSSGLTYSAGVLDVDGLVDITNGINVEGSQTVTANAVNSVNYGGTATATSNNAYGVRYNHILTANNSINHAVSGVRYTPTLIASSNNNFLYGVQIDATFTNGAFTSVANVPLLITESSTFGQTIRIQNTASTSVCGIDMRSNLNVQRLLLSHNGSTGLTLLSLAGTDNRINTSNSDLLIQTSFGTRARYALADGTYIHTPGSSAATSGTGIAHTLTRNFITTSGTGLHNWLQIDGIINQTGGASGITRGIYLNHTLTAAADYRAIETTAGKVIIGGATGALTVGTSASPASAKVDIQSTNQGFLPPRGTNAQMLAIASPAPGLMFYDTTNNQMNYYNGTTWIAF